MTLDIEIQFGLVNKVSCVHLLPGGASDGIDLPRLTYPMPYPPSIHRQDPKRAKNGPPSFASFVPLR